VKETEISKILGKRVVIIGNF